MVHQSQLCWMCFILRRDSQSVIIIDVIRWHKTSVESYCPFKLEFPRQSSLQLASIRTKEIRY